VSWKASEAGLRKRGRFGLLMSFSRVLKGLAVNAHVRSGSLAFHAARLHDGHEPRYHAIQPLVDHSHNGIRCCDE